MKCYMCAASGTEMDAVAVCVSCGSGVCREHLHCREEEVWEGDYPFPSRKAKNPKVQMLCPACCKVYERR